MIKSIVILVLVGAVGCSNNASVQTQQELKRDRITYRQLTVSDFRGAEPAGNLGYFGRLHAYVVPQKSARIRAAVQDDGTYRASFKDLRFVGVMDRSKSYLSDGGGNYIAEPEWMAVNLFQVAFMLRELQARKFNREIKEILEATIGHGPTKKQHARTHQIN